MPLLCPNEAECHRLLHHFSLGALSGRDVARLMAELEAGLAEGASRYGR